MHNHTNPVWALRPYTHPLPPPKHPNTHTHTHAHKNTKKRVTPILPNIGYSRVSNLLEKRLTSNTYHVSHMRNLLIANQTKKYLYKFDFFSLTMLSRMKDLIY